MTSYIQESMASGLPSQLRWNWQTWQQSCPRPGLQAEADCRLHRLKKHLTHLTTSLRTNYRRQELTASPGSKINRQQAEQEDRKKTQKKIQRLQNRGIRIATISVQGWKYFRYTRTNRTEDNWPETWGTPTNPDVRMDQGRQVYNVGSTRRTRQSSN